MDTPNPETAAAIRRIQWLTVGWMTIEVGIAFVAALRAHSVALAAFGGDSAIELLSTFTRVTGGSRQIPQPA